MTQVLLHTSVANCGSRTLAPIFDLGLTAQPWLTQTPQSVENQIESLDSAVHRQACIIKRLSTPRSIWYLACITVPNPSEPELRQSSNQDIERLSDFRLIHIKASIIHVDMRDRDEVAFKLTTESINSLVEYYERSHRVGPVAKTHERSRNDRVRIKVCNDFTRAIKEFVYRTHVYALEGLEKNGAGELLVNDSEKVKEIILSMM
ncbi:hypothetical protein CABS01_16921 [Colletotrichum abscissum]|uniref:uncharacterized protein n=1 Tax=Colletotrichum abscissum TaxID=1671311 RepID=UPI0027D704CD|nr:uncharacterized protein CABS01_16921 [Colletotrichum abscissum]KAK1504340.1 hypothetical protein CABS01_16921 [Colletotrichum abscissum]